MSSPYKKILYVDGKKRKLFKINLHGLIKQAVVQVLVLNLVLFFTVFLQTKQTGSIAFVYCNFKVGSGIENSKLFTFLHISVSVAYFVDNLVSFESNFKASSLSLFFKFF